MASAAIRSALVACVMLLVAACSSTPSRPPATYTVKRGDTLYSIAFRHGLDYRDVARWNRIGRDFLIHPGQVLVLVPRAGQPARSTVAAAPRAVPALPANATLKWEWPTEATQVESTTRPNSSRGLTLAGRLGQPVRAAAAGRVVYVGSGLLGYGQLVIVKHDDRFLSAYGHAQSVLVKEGETVAPGQAMATMGEGPGGRPMLYFEVRVDGQPIDPLAVLPRPPETR
jgi:lipoprotein NlpD